VELNSIQTTAIDSMVRSFRETHKYNNVVISLSQLLQIPTTTQKSAVILSKVYITHRRPHTQPMVNNCTDYAQKS